jgi:hypothetical protein
MNLSLSSNDRNDPKLLINYFPIGPIQISMLWLLYPQSIHHIKINKEKQSFAFIFAEYCALSY